MITKIAGVGMGAISLCLPAANPTLQEFTNNKLSDAQIKRFTKYTGFQRLRITDGDTKTSDLCISAAQGILESTVAKDAIDGLIFVTTTPNWPTPATSHYICHQLGLSENCMCLDINEACSGYVAGYYTAACMIKAGHCRNVLLLCGDTASRYTDPEDDATHLLFGEAGSATLVTGMQVDNYFANKTFGDRHTALMAQYEAVMGKSGFLRMDGETITDFTLNDVPGCIEGLLAYAGIGKDEINLFACHQANKLILTALAKKLGVPMEKVPFAAENTGNLMSASIPGLLTIGEYPQLDKVMLCGFGAGLACAVCLTDLTETKFCGVRIYE